LFKKLKKKCQRNKIKLKEEHQKKLNKTLKYKKLKTTKKREDTRKIKKLHTLKLAPCIQNAWKESDTN